MDRVLVVDDNRENADLLAESLSRMDYEVDVANDGDEALKKVELKKPDLVVLDVMMPKMDGFEVCNVLKSNPSTHAIPVILLTSRKDTPDKVKGLDIGADDYMTKPFNPRELAARVRMLIKRRHSENQRAVEEKMGALGLMAEGVAHEVRNPMVAIGGFARRIHASLPEDDKRRGYAQHIISEVERLERMVNAIVSFKTLNLNPAALLDLAEVAGTAVEDKANALKEKKIAAVVEAAKGDLSIIGDRANLLIALSALIENSMEAMEEGGTLKIAVQPVDGESVRLTISDTGHGISREDLPHVFNPFFTSKMSGAGIGLTIVHRVVVQHKGTIDIKSEPEAGTVVTIELPRGKVCEI